MLYAVLPVESLWSLKQIFQIGALIIENSDISLQNQYISGQKLTCNLVPCQTSQAVRDYHKLKIRICATGSLGLLFHSTMRIFRNSSVLLLLLYMPPTCLPFSNCLNSGPSCELPWKPEISTACLFFLTLSVFSRYTDFNQGILVTIEILVNFYPIYM